VEEPTIMQLAYINGLYNDLDILYSKRVKSTSKQEASVLIDTLKKAIEEKKNKEVEDVD
jgi:hypothetical protein